MRLTLLALAVLSIGFAFPAAATPSHNSAGAAMAGGAEPAAMPAAEPGDPVIQWNRILLAILRTPPAPGSRPSTVHPTRSLAILHAAIYDAVNAIDGTHAPYLVSLRAPRGASPEAAAVAAAYSTLVALFPEQRQMLDARLQEAMASIPDRPGKQSGFRLGQEVAQRILDLRRQDGSDAPPLPFTPGTQPGDYQLTPPLFAPPVFTHWSSVTPFTLLRANQFRPGPPPALASAAYTAAFQETKELGSRDSATRTADQTQSANFWKGKIQNYWNEIAQTAALAHKITLAQNARLFALLNLTLADDVIAFYDAKYAYRVWRPVTAIRAADTDDNPDTHADPNWTPLADTPQDPSYPGAHSVISASGAAILGFFFGSDDFDLTVRSESLPGVERSFTRFSAAAEEAGLSRISAGHHFRFDHIAGRELGSKIASYVSHNFLLARRRSYGR